MHVFHLGQITLTVLEQVDYYGQGGNVVSIIITWGNFPLTTLKNDASAVLLTVNNSGALFTRKDNAILMVKPQFVAYNFR